MSKDELITQQQLEIENLKLDDAGINRGLRDVHELIHSIGGPLNDNTDKFTYEQLQIFTAISTHLDLQNREYRID